MKTILPQLRFILLTGMLTAGLIGCKKDSTDSDTLPPGVTKESDGFYYVKDVVTWPNKTTDGSTDYEFDAPLIVSGRLIIEPGVKVVFHQSSMINPATYILVSGNIVANGTSENPIEFSGDGTNNSFTKINLQNNNTEVNEFSYCIFNRNWADNYPGHTNEFTYVDGLLESVGNPYSTQNINVKVNHCTFKNGNLGVKFGDNVNLLEFNNNLITSNLILDYSALFDIHCVGAVNSSNNFYGNSNNQVAVISYGPGSYPKTLKDAVTIHKLDGTSYVYDAGFGSYIVLEGGTITLEPGVEQVFPILCQSGSSPSQTGDLTTGYSFFCN